MEIIRKNSVIESIEVAICSASDNDFSCCCLVNDG